MYLAQIGRPLYASRNRWWRSTAHIDWQGTYSLIVRNVSWLMLTASHCTWILTLDVVFARRTPKYSMNHKGSFHRKGSLYLARLGSRGSVACVGIHGIQGLSCLLSLKLPWCLPGKASNLCLRDISILHESYTLESKKLRLGVHKVFETFQRKKSMSDK